MYRIPPSPFSCSSPISAGFGGVSPPSYHVSSHRRHAAARREVVVRRRRRWERGAVERRRLRFDDGRHPELERPERMVDQVRTHVTERALTPVDPAAPVERVVDGVVRHFWRRAKEQIPVQRRRYLEVAVHRRRQASLEQPPAPARRLRILRHFGHRRRARNALRPVAERPVGPDVDLADVADGAAGDVLVAGSRLVARMALVTHLGDDLGVLLGLLRQVARFLHRPAERLLHVHVFADAHRRAGNRSVHVIRRGDDDTVDVFRLVEHLAVIVILLDLRNVVGEALQIRGVVLTRTARVHVLLSL